MTTIILTGRWGMLIQKIKDYFNSNQPTGSGKVHRMLSWPAPRPQHLGLQNLPTDTKESNPLLVNDRYFENGDGI